VACNTAVTFHENLTFGLKVVKAGQTRTHGHDDDDTMPAIYKKKNRSKYTGLTLSDFSVFVLKETRHFEVFLRSAWDEQVSYGRFEVFMAATLTFLPDYTVSYPRRR